MFNAPRVAVTVAVLALVAGLAYVAVPSVERVVTPAAPASVIDPTDFAGFSGTFRAVPCRDGETTEFDWGRTTNGEYCSPMMLDVSDERLSGTARAAHNAVSFKNGPAYGVRTISTELSNENGTWEGTGIAFHDPTEGIMRYELMLSGHGRYEGLSALLSLTSDRSYLGHDATGVIFPGELPPYPVLSEVEAPSAWTGRIDPDDYAGVTGLTKVSPGEWGELHVTDWGQTARGNHYQDIEVEANDPRLTGKQESLINFDHFVGGPKWGVRTTASEIVNDGGSWISTLSYGYQDAGTTGMHYANVYRGTGDYEGLSAVTITSQDEWGFWMDTDGVIFPGELPPYPELPPAE
jgi:hypothetical protein